MAAMGGIFLAVALGIASQAQDSLCRPSVSASLEKEARDAMSTREYPLAARRFQDAFDACPQRESILLGLAQAQVLGREFDKAIGTAERVLRDHPEQAAALKIKGNAAYLLGDFDKAKDTFIRLLDRHPADEEGAYMLGRIYYQEEYLDLAIGQFDRVLKINPGSYKALDNLGLCYQAMGDDDRAMRYFLTAIKLVEKDHPEYEWPYTNVADLLLKNGDPQRAFDAAAKASNRNPMSARSFYIGAKALEQLGKTELSLNWLQRAVAVDAASSESWYMLWRVYRKLQQNDKADEALQKFRELKAKEPARRR
jgi:tetratricopeptide (TPR) repeat protein